MGADVCDLHRRRKTERENETKDGKPDKPQGHNDGEKKTRGARAAQVEKSIISSPSGAV
jgi:hypothetical protein